MDWICYTFGGLALMVILVGGAAWYLHKESKDWFAEEELP